MKKLLFCGIALILTFVAHAQVGIGSSTPHSSSLLDLSSNNKGFLPPRMTQAQRNAITSPATALQVWCTNCGTAGEWQIFNGTTWTNMNGGTASAGTITGLTCSSATNNGSLNSGILASGVSSVVPYTGGNGNTHTGQTITSTGVNGLTATLSSGTFASGSGSLTYTITGTPTRAGTATFALNIGGQTCNLTRTVVCGTSVTFTYNGSSVTYDIVSRAYGGSVGTKCWLDRNLGATQVATSSTDANSYGDLFQWGRGADGHQIRTSGVTSATSSSTTPGTDFLRGSDNWYTGSSSLWQGVSGINNPCPSGFRLPTDVEWNAELLSWGSGNDNAASAYASVLKLPMAGFRDDGGGSTYSVGTNGHYWSSTPTINLSYRSSNSLYFYSGVAYMSSNDRAVGATVRCVNGD